MFLSLFLMYDYCFKSHLYVSKWHRFQCSFPNSILPEKVPANNANGYSDIGELKLIIFSECWWHFVISNKILSPTSVTNIDVANTIFWWILLKDISIWLLYSEPHLGWLQYSLDLSTLTVTSFQVVSKVGWASRKFIPLI